MFYIGPIMTCDEFIDVIIRIDDALGSEVVAVMNHLHQCRRCWLMTIDIASRTPRTPDIDQLADDIVAKHRKAMDDPENKT